MSKSNISIKSSELLKILELSADFNGPDIEVDNLVKTPQSNALIFINNFKELDYVKTKVHNSIILVNYTCNKVSVDGDNIIIESNSYYRDYIRILKGFKIDQINWEHKLDQYNSITKKCIILSKSAKIYNCRMGKHCSIHHNVLIGVDNLITVRTPTGLKSLPTIGLVDIGDNVDIFNNSIVYRGFLGITKIGNGVKIGANTVIGSDVSIGDNVLIGNNCVIENNVIIPEGSVVASRAVVDLTTELD